jgi:hypothetical protein
MDWLVVTLAVEVGSRQWPLFTPIQRTMMLNRAASVTDNL